MDDMALQVSFNPRARVGRDGKEIELTSRVKVVSIHAPAWGATSQSTVRLLRSKSFNPRARVGRDVAETGRCAVRCRVSIHAPAWGATNNN